MTILTDIERDRTIAHGKRTFFVEGIYSWQVLENWITSDVEHIHFGTNGSFDDTNIDQWEVMITPALKLNRWVTLEFDAKYIETVIECGFTEYHNFIPKIKVLLPYIGLLNYHTVIKFDDNMKKTNPGTWTHHLHELLTQTKFNPGKM